MKRIILAAMAFILIFALCACGGENSGTSSPTTQESAQPAQTQAAVPSQNAAEQKQEGRGDIITNEPDEGRGDVIGSDPGDSDYIPWEGTYVNGGYYLEISNVNSHDFNYEITLSTATSRTVISEGSGEIDGTGFFATAGDMGFSMYKDYSAIDVFASESSELAEMCGQYGRIG